MGSDLHMAQESFRPRPNKVSWIDEDTIKIEQDRFYTGYVTIYKGKVTPEIKTLLSGMGIRLPEKPTKRTHTYEFLVTVTEFSDEGTYNFELAMEAMQDAASGLSTDEACKVQVVRTRTR